MSLFGSIKSVPSYPPYCKALHGARWPFSTGQPLAGSSLPQTGPIILCDDWKGLASEELALIQGWATGGRFSKQPSKARDTGRGKERHFKQPKGSHKSIWQGCFKGSMHSTAKHESAWERVWAIKHSAKWGLFGCSSQPHVTFPDGPLWRGTSVLARVALCVSRTALWDRVTFGNARSKYWNKSVNLFWNVVFKSYIYK